MSTLNENFEGAITDFEKCLAIREEECEPHDPRLCDVHSALWEAHGMASQGSEKDHHTPYLHHLKKNLECMEACVKRCTSDLEAVMAGMEDPKGRSLETLTEEVKKWTETIPEIKETIAAASESASSAQALKDHIKDTNAENTTPSVENPVVTTTGLGGFAMASDAASAAAVSAFAVALVGAQ